jgi:enoyl-CoA hydratase/3-hydroxyacyl-CoA dehydrogenase
MSTADVSSQELVERFTLKSFVESCRVLEEGVATLKDIDLGMMAGAGLIPPPFARADATGLDEVLAALERAEREWGEHFAPPLILKRLVAQGRLGQKSGQGFFPYPQPDSGFEGKKVQLETRGAIAIVWLSNPPANSLSPEVLAELREAWERVRDSDEIRVMVVASANPMLFCAGADIKSFTKISDPEKEGRDLLNAGHDMFREWEQDSTVTIAAVNALAFGGGCEMAMACDFRIAAESALFGQPEINLGIIPGFGGTQRLPRLVGESKALEMNLTGESISAEDALDHGLVSRVVPDHELFDTALQWARKLSEQAPKAVQQIKQVSHQGDLDHGIKVEKDGFIKAISTEDAKEGITAFLGKRKAQFKGK